MHMVDKKKTKVTFKFGNIVFFALVGVEGMKDRLE